MASTLHNRKDVTSVRVEGFPSPDAKTMMEVMMIVNGIRSRSGLEKDQLIDFDY